MLIYVVRLFGLQVGDDKYKESADSNAFLRRVIYPARGLVYDRNDRLVVFNRPAYEVMVIPKDVGEFDTTAFCSTLEITREELAERWAAMKDTRKNPGYSAYTPQKLISHLSQEEHGKLQEKLLSFPGFFIQKRSEREYVYHAGANILGNIREVSASDMEKDSYYRRGDYTGDLGVGEKLRDGSTREKGGGDSDARCERTHQGKYENGIHDIPPESGHNLKLSIDIELQEYGEQLMRNKIGAIVAIEPSTGEILALYVTSPNYDPSLLVGGDRGKTMYRSLMISTNHCTTDLYKEHILLGQRLSRHRV